MILHLNAMRPLRIKQALLVIAAALSLDVLPSEGSVRGTAPESANIYATALKSGKFHCLDGSKTVRAAAINDNYCDCLDGSDEPGAMHHTGLPGMSSEQLPLRWMQSHSLQPFKLQCKRCISRHNSGSL